MIPLLLLGTAFAAMVDVTEVPCPLGDGIVRIYTQVSTDLQGGFDSDLATYSSSGQFRTHAVSTCPDNLFSLYGVDMTGTLSEEERTAVRIALANAVAQLSNPENPTVWDRYSIAGAMYQALEAPPMRLGRLYLEASWTVRDQGVGIFVGLEGPAAAEAILAHGQKELASQDDPTKRKTLLHNLARVAHRAGNNAQRDEYLRQMAEVVPLSKAEQQAIDRLRMSAELEPMYQDLAMSFFRAVRAQEDNSVQERAMATYLLADLLRRRGQPDAAKPLFEGVIQDPGATPQVRRMAEHFVGTESRP